MRRRFRDPLYHAVLERYVQRAVAQGIFIEGGLSRDGRLQGPKLGLLWRGATGRFHRFG